jgi:hypothetical protein
MFMNINRIIKRRISLIAPLLALGLVAYLAVYVLPDYKERSIRSKVNEALGAGLSGKSTVHEVCQSEPDTNFNEWKGYRYVTSGYVSEVIIGGTCREAYVELTTQNTGARRALVVDFVGKYQPSTGEFSWSCTRFRGDARYLPENCREDSPFM